MTAGIYGSIVNGRELQERCLVIGDGVPRIHHSDGLAVYLVIESDDGIPVLMKDHGLKNLLAYPSHWPAAGEYNPKRWLFAEHEHLAWHALIPCFDGETT